MQLLSFPLTLYVCWFDKQGAAETALYKGLHQIPQESVPHVVRAHTRTDHTRTDHTCTVECAAFCRCVQQTQGFGRMAAGGGTEAKKPSCPEKAGSE